MLITHKNPVHFGEKSMNNINFNPLSQIPGMGQMLSTDKISETKMTSVPLSQQNYSKPGSYKCDLESTADGDDFLRILQKNACNERAQDMEKSQGTQGLPDTLSNTLQKTDFATIPVNVLQTGIQAISRNCQDVLTLEFLLENEERLTPNTAYISPVSRQECSGFKSAGIAFLPFLNLRNEAGASKKAFKKKIFRDLTHRNTNNKKNYDFSGSDDSAGFLAY